MLPLIEDFFGLKRYSKAEMDSLNELVKNGDAAAYETLGMALTDYELSDLEAAFNWNLQEMKDRPIFTSEAYWAAYGYYEPFTIKLTHILNHKAGIGWTTYSHTGLPTPVSVVGVGQELFNGYYDNTDIFKKVVTIGSLL